MLGFPLWLDQISYGSVSLKFYMNDNSMTCNQLVESKPESHFNFGSFGQAVTYLLLHRVIVSLKTIMLTRGDSGYYF